MRRQILAVSGLVAVGAGALLFGHVKLPPLPLDLEPRPEATPSPSATAPSSPTGSQTSTPADAQSTAAAAAETTLDVARISPDGSSVLAGRSKPGAYVTLLEDGKPVGSAKADDNGEWSLVTEHRFASLDPHLSFEASDVPPAPQQNSASGAPVATASVAPDAADKSGQPARTAEKPAAVTTEILRKFESLVAEAREEAKREKEAAAQPAPQSAPPAPASSVPASPETAASAAGSSQAPASPSVRIAEAADSAASKGDSQSDAASSDATIPVPITFVYAEATLTGDGRHATDLLLEYLKLKHFEEVKLSGHADERGSNEFNMDLSRERLDAVAALLREGGYSGRLDLVPKGESEPYAGVDRNRYAAEDLFQLDRRVELRFTR
jgi:outer membrane protein OmpA-like peptidoglycan-associated protein